MKLDMNDLHFTQFRGGQEIVEVRHLPTGTTVRGSFSDVEFPSSLVLRAYLLGKLEVRLENIGWKL